MLGKIYDHELQSKTFREKLNYLRGEICNRYDTNEASLDMDLVIDILVGLNNAIAAQEGHGHQVS